MNNLVLKNISKYFYEQKGLGLFKEKKHILEEISFTLDEKEILGLIGKNGAGKSTLIKIIAGLIFPDSGNISSNKNKIILVNSNPRSFYWRLTCLDNLKFFGGLTGSNKNELEYDISKYNHLFDMKDVIQMPFRFLSSGQMQIMSLIRSLISRPKILLLDEPTINLDYDFKQLYISVVKDYVQHNNGSAVWCSHDFYEINDVADTVGSIDKRKFIKLDQGINNLSNKASSNYKIEIKADELYKLESLSMRYIQVDSKKSRGSVFINFLNNNEDISVLLKKIHNKNINIYSVIPIHQNIFRRPTN